MTKEESLKIGDECKKFEERIIKLCNKYGAEDGEYEADGVHGYSLKILIKKESDNK